VTIATHTGTAATRQRKARAKRQRAKATSLNGDMRTRLAKRFRALEAEYTAMVQGQGRVLDVNVLLCISNLATAVVQVEIHRAQIMRGVRTDPETLRAWLTTARKEADRLGVDASVVDGPAAPPKPVRPLSAVLKELAP
jgi:hypothetical protein